MTVVRRRFGAREAGLSLVEIMVAMVVGIILVGGAFQVFLSVKQTWRVQESLSRLQENGRFATSELSRSLRSAGFFGCVPDKVNNMLDPAGTGYSNAIFSFNRPVSGWEAAGTAPDDEYSITSFDPDGIALSSWDDDAGQDLLAYLEDRVVPGTDVIVIKRAEVHDGVTASGNTPANATTISLTGPSGVEQGSIVLVSDCAGADAFQSTANDNANTLTFSAGAAGGEPGNDNSASLSHQYGPGMQIYSIAIDAYYIGISEFSGRPSLFRMRFSEGTPPDTTDPGIVQELVEGVDNLQLLYGEDNDDDQAVDRYVPADQVADWGTVSAVRAAMLITSPNPALVEARDAGFMLNGVEVDPPADRRQRQVFTATVALRNRLP